MFSIYFHSFFATSRKLAVERFIDCTYHINVLYGFILTHLQRAVRVCLFCLIFFVCLGKKHLFRCYQLVGRNHLLSQTLLSE